MDLYDELRGVLSGQLLTVDFIIVDDNLESAWRSRAKLDTADIEKLKDIDR